MSSLGGHLSVIMDHDSVSSSGSIRSSICDVCREMFEFDNARSDVGVGINNTMIPFGDHVYTYVHHAHVVALLASAEAGCDLLVCTLFVKKLKKPGSIMLQEKRDAALRSILAISKRTGTQSGQVDFAATRLANIMRGRGTPMENEQFEHGPRCP